VSVSPLNRIGAESAPHHVQALRALAQIINALADVMEGEAAAGEHRPDERPQPGAFDARGAAAYSGIGSTLLREQGPPPRYIGGRSVWRREDLDAWLAELPVERTHARGRRRSGDSRGVKADL